MGTFSTTAKNSMLDSLTIDRLSLHSGDPGVDGTANEISGGSPAYARKAATYGAAASGVRTLSTAVEFDVPAGSTVAYVGKWSYNAGTMIFHGADAVTNETFGGQGTYTVTATTSKVEITDA